MLKKVLESYRDEITFSSLLFFAGGTYLAYGGDPLSLTVGLTMGMLGLAGLLWVMTVNNGDPS